MNCKKTIIPLVVVISSICTIILSVVFANGFKGEELRERYPLITEADYIFDSPQFEFEDNIKFAPNIAEIQIVKKLDDYTVEIIDEDIGVLDNAKFHQYKAKVLNNFGNTDLNLGFDDTITICYADMFASSYPDLKTGMTAICSLEAASGEHSGKYLFYDKSFYYIVNDTALSAYAGDTSPAKKQCKKHILVNEIKKIRKSVK